MNRLKHLKEWCAIQFADHSRRIDATNEIRGQLTDQALRYATKEQVDQLDKLVQELRVTGGSAAGRAPFIDAIVKFGLGVLIGWAIFVLTK